MGVDGEDKQPMKPKKEARESVGQGHPSVIDARPAIEAFLAMGMANWQRPAIPDVELQNAQMLNSLVLAASLQHGIEAQKQSAGPSHPKPIPIRPHILDIPSLETESLHSRNSKRDLTNEDKEEAARKRSKSEDNLLSMDEQGSINPLSPQARAKKGGSAFKLSAIHEQDQLTTRDEEGHIDNEDMEGTQDDREAKKIRRKQSNRESARRSRLRKQKESEALSSSVVGLKQENNLLREANRSLQAKLDALTEQIAQGNLIKESSPKATLAQKTSAFQVVQRRPSDLSTDSQSQSLGPNIRLLQVASPGQGISGGHIETK